VVSVFLSLWSLCETVPFAYEPHQKTEEGIRLRQSHYAALSLIVIRQRTESAPAEEDGKKLICLFVPASGVGEKLICLPREAG